MIYILSSFFYSDTITVHTSLKLLCIGVQRKIGCYLNCDSSNFFKINYFWSILSRIGIIWQLSSLFITLLLFFFFVFRRCWCTLYSMLLFLLLLLQWDILLVNWRYILSHFLIPGLLQSCRFSLLLVSANTHVLWLFCEKLCDNNNLCFRYTSLEGHVWLLK